ncbi:MAG: Helix-turn-helix transcriptional regulator [uncultured Clostridium sp.]
MLTTLELERRKQGLTQSQLRDKALVGLNTIVSLEKGNIDGVRVKTLKKIAKALDTTVVELFFSEEE